MRMRKDLVMGVAVKGYVTHGGCPFCGGVLTSDFGLVRATVNYPPGHLDYRHSCRACGSAWLKTWKTGAAWHLVKVKVTT